MVNRLTVIASHAICTSHQLDAITTDCSVVLKADVIQMAHAHASEQLLYRLSSDTHTDISKCQDNLIYYLNVAASILQTVSVMSGEAGSIFQTIVESIAICQVKFPSTNYTHIQKIVKFWVLQCTGYKASICIASRVFPFNEDPFGGRAESHVEFRLIDSDRSKYVDTAIYKSSPYSVFDLYRRLSSN